MIFRTRRPRAKQAGAQDDDARPTLAETPSMIRAGYALPRRWAAALLALTAVAGLSACAEVTRFERSDGTSLYYINCRDGLNWFESCRSAAMRVCPNGYAKADVDLALADKQEPLRKFRRSDSFFVCQ